jgi:hypothetical protein
VLSIGGIGESQTQSKFPKLSEDEAISTRVLMCPTNLILITNYAHENIVFVALETEDVLFAVVKFQKDGKYIGSFILQPNKSVVFYNAAEDEKTPGVCESLEALNIRNEKNKF